MRKIITVTGEIAPEELGVTSQAVFFRTQLIGPSDGYLESVGFKIGGIFGGLAFCDALECRKAEPRSDNLRNSHGDSSACESGANARYESVGLPAEILYHARLRRQDT